MKVVHKKVLGKTIKKKGLTDLEKEAKKREKIILHYQEFGIKSTLSAFDVGKTSLFRWKKKYTQSYNDYRSLISKSRKRRTRNTRYVDFRILKFIQEQRFKQTLGKEKLYHMLIPKCSLWNISTPSISTIGRIIKGMKQNKQIPSYDQVTYYASSSRIKTRTEKNKIKKRRKGFNPSSPGDLCQMDTVENRIHGTKRYTINIIDLYTRLTYSKSFTTLNSKNAQETLIEAQDYFGFKIKRIQSDNGLEFHKDFDVYLHKNKITHYWNYPKCPKMNAYIERYNRTIQEEFIYRNIPLMKSDLDYVNEVLLPQYLHYYNRQRLHQSLDYMTPYDYYIQYQSKSAK